MNNNLIQLTGYSIAVSNVILSKAKNLIVAIEANCFATLHKVITDEDKSETVIFEVDVEVPQHPVNDVRKKEAIAVIFDAHDKTLPKVLTLREDFPHLPHQLLEANEKPRSLCLYDISYDDVQIFWTGFIFLERIREWLKLSALGQLHQDDQPLEPLLYSNEGTILFDRFSPNKEFFIYRIAEDYYKRITLLATPKQLPGGNQFHARFDYLKGKPQQHGIISRAPQNLSQLNDLLAKAEIDFSTWLKDTLLSYKATKVNLQQRLLLLIELPKVRAEKSETVHSDYFVFLSSSTIVEIGVKFNLWAIIDKDLEPGLVWGEPTNIEALTELEIGILSPVFSYERSLANFLNGVTLENTSIPILAVGAGALGSQLVLNLVRAGVGTWKIADSDIVLPHNLSRSSYLGYDSMKSKSEQLAIQVNTILPGAAEPLVLNVIADKDEALLKLAIKEANLILDVSASTAAVKALCDQSERGRICSCFLNPSGTDFVVIAEDKALQFNATNLEIQYLRFLLHEPLFHDHFKKEGQVVRYSTGCRDISIILPQDSIAIAAGIGSKVIKQLLVDDKAMIKLWRTDSETFDVKIYEVPIAKPSFVKVHDWSVIYDQHVLGKIYNQRGLKLPNETGGILIGTYDMQRKVIFLADIISSPEDSCEYPTAYIRGIKNVGKELNRIKDITAGGLQYIGEWHTHPKGYGSRMSSDDSILFNWLKKNMVIEGLPAFMLIAGENYTFYLDAS